MIDAGRLHDHKEDMLTHGHHKMQVRIIQIKEEIRFDVWFLTYLRGSLILRNLRAYIRALRKTK